MLGKIQNQPENHQFDVCGRVYYTDVCYDNGKGELVAETVNATSHDDAESVFRSNLMEHARKFDLVVDRIEITFTLDLAYAKSHYGAVN